MSQPLEARARQLWKEFDLPASMGTGDIDAAPYLIRCFYSAPYTVPNMQHGTILKPANIELRIYEAKELKAGGTMFTEPLLNTLRSPFPDNILRFKLNWDSRRDLLENSFRLSVVLTRIFAILIPEHMP